MTAAPAAPGAPLRVPAGTVKCLLARISMDVVQVTLTCAASLSGQLAEITPKAAFPVSQPESLNEVAWNVFISEDDGFTT